MGEAPRGGGNGGSTKGENGGKYKGRNGGSTKGENGGTPGEKMGEHQGHIWSDVLNRWVNFGKPCG